LNSGQILIGGTDNIAHPQTLTGDVVISNEGAFTINNVLTGTGSTGFSISNQPAVSGTLVSGTSVMTESMTDQEAFFNGSRWLDPSQLQASTSGAGTNVDNLGYPGTRLTLNGSPTGACAEITFSGDGGVCNPAHPWRIEWFTCPVNSQSNTANMGLFSGTHANGVLVGNGVAAVLLNGTGAQVQIYTGGSLHTATVAVYGVFGGNFAAQRDALCAVWDGVGTITLYGSVNDNSSSMPRLQQLVTLTQPYSGAQSRNAEFALEATGPAGNFLQGAAFQAIQYGDY